MGTAGLISRLDRGFGGETNTGDGGLGAEGPAVLQLLLLAFSLSLKVPLTPGRFGWEAFLLVWSGFGSGSRFLFLFPVTLLFSTVFSTVLLNAPLALFSGFPAKDRSNGSDPLFDVLGATSF